MPTQVYKTLPAHLQRYFWDVEQKTIDPEMYPRYVIERLLERGKKDAYDYLVKTFPRETIVQTLKNSRGFSAKSANFWALYFGIPKDDVLCLQKEFPNPPVRLWQH